MSEWREVTLGECLTFRNGKTVDLLNEGNVPVYGANGQYAVSGSSNLEDDAIVIGRVGSFCGSVHFVNAGAWITENALIATPRDKGAARFWAYSLKNLKLNSWRSGSGQPLLNQSILGGIPTVAPPLAEQRAIAEVLGALDDKIAANTRLAATADELARDLYRARTLAWDRVPLSSILDPILGGTPARSKQEYWADGVCRWISAKDVTGANANVVLETAERITLLATEKTKAKPLPSGSVILTARGTVGEVARLAEPAAFNQSCYGFVPGVVPQSILFFSLLFAAKHARSLAHGSVFDTITKQSFDHLTMAWNSHEAAAVEEALVPLLGIVESAVRENRTLAETRDALLPKLMSGQLRVLDAERIAEAAGA
ncbi:restriction endonuclease subunit S [Leucobacter sp. HY1908]